jgi:hypothetical protein
MIEKLIGIGLIVIEQPNTSTAKVLVFPRRKPDLPGHSHTRRIQNFDHFVVHFSASEISRLLELLERLKRLEPSLDKQ